MGSYSIARDQEKRENMRVPNAPERDKRENTWVPNAREREKHENSWFLMPQGGRSVKAPEFPTPRARIYCNLRGIVALGVLAQPQEAPGGPSKAPMERSVHTHGFLTPQGGRSVTRPSRPRAGEA